MKAVIFETAEEATEEAKRLNRENEIQGLFYKCQQLTPSELDSPIYAVVSEEESGYYNLHVVGHQFETCPQEEAA